jgi:hypothetical protein
LSKDIEKSSGDPRTEALGQLDDREASALAVYEASTLPPIAAGTADNLFKLFLRGCSTEEIRKLNQFTFGQIIDARVRYSWDRRKAEYDLQLVTDGADAIKRSQMEAALLAADLITASAHLNRQKIQRYLQTGDEAHIKDVDVGSLKQLHQALEVLLKATRQDTPAGSRGTPTPEPPLRPTVDVQVTQALPAAGILALAAGKREHKLAERAAAKARKKPA